MSDPAPTALSLRHLYETADAMKWAEAFCAVVRETPGIVVDEELMVCWFANAMVTAEDHAVKREKARPVVDRIREAVFQAAGAGAGIALPNDQDFPGDEIAAAVERICDENGLAQSSEND